MCPSKSVIYGTQTNCQIWSISYLQDFIFHKSVHRPKKQLSDFAQQSVNSVSNFSVEIHPGQAQFMVPHVAQLLQCMSYAFWLQVHEDHDRLWPDPHGLWSSLRKTTCSINGRLIFLLIDWWESGLSSIDVIHVCRSACLNDVNSGTATSHIQ